MQSDGYSFATDSVAKFFGSIVIRGWFHHPSDTLISAVMVDRNVFSQRCSVGLDHGGVEKNLGPRKGFVVQAFMNTDDFPQSASVRFETKNGSVLRISLQSFVEEASARDKSSQLSQRFMTEIQNYRRVLDIGGRDRSGVDRSRDFVHNEVTVLDILPGRNVDVVGDAHELSKYFAPETFDAVYSVSVFEHLMMPWKVVTEMNKIMKLGAIGFVHTHQTIGMHDLPWDFWRYSDTAWKGLFNARTGFEIVDTALSSEQYVISFHYQDRYVDAEKSAGFESSSVLIRKIGECAEQWAAGLTDLDDTTYPHGNH